MLTADIVIFIIVFMDKYSLFLMLFIFIYEFQRRMFVGDRKKSQFPLDVLILTSRKCRNGDFFEKKVAISVQCSHEAP